MIRDIGTEHLRCLQLQLGGDRNFQYLLGDPGSRAAAAVDPGFDADRFATLAAEQGMDITAILVTHGHPDHDAEAAALAAATGAPVHSGRTLNDRQVIGVGGLVVEALLTPGHAPDHVCYRAGNVLVTGDLLFCGKVGGTGEWFPGSSAEQEWTSLQRVLQLPDETVVLPGHDYFGGEGAMPHSTIGHERAHNPFLAGDFAAFVHLKDNWAAYKEEHGIR